MNEPQLQSIGQIHLTVSDIDASVAFYRDVLGLDFLFDVPGQSMAFFDCGGVRLYLGAAEGLDRPSHPVIYYRVPNIETACAALEARGVDLREPAHVVHRTESMELWLASVEDPEGNPVCLMEERQAT